VLAFLKYVRTADRADLLRMARLAPWRMAFWADLVLATLDVESPQIVLARSIAPILRRSARAAA
jgi:hypothetical protein